MLEILRSLLLERSIIVVSQGDNLGLASSIVNTLRMLVYPLVWVQTVIPILPFELIDMLDAPMPYLIGICEEHWDYYDEN